MTGFSISTRIGLYDGLAANATKLLSSEYSWFCLLATCIAVLNRRICGGNGENTAGHTFIRKMAICEESAGLCMTGCKRRKSQLLRVHVDLDFICLTHMITDLALQ